MAAAKSALGNSSWWQRFPNHDNYRVSEDRQLSVKVETALFAQSYAKPNKWYLTIPIILLLLQAFTFQLPQEISEIPAVMMQT